MSAPNKPNTSPHTSANSAVTSLQRTFLAAFILLCIVLGLGLNNIARQGLGLQTDLLGLLPATPQAAATQRASAALREELGDAFVFLFSGTDRDTVTAAMQLAAQLIAANPMSQLADAQAIADDQFDYVDLLKKYRFNLLTPQQQQQLREQTEHSTSALLQQAWQSLYSPGNFASYATPLEDPLNLFNQYMDRSMASPAAMEMTAYGLLVNETERQDAPGLVHGLIHGVALGGAFNLDTQKAFEQLLQQLETQLAAQHPSLGFNRAGAVFHGAIAASAAKQEISLIAGGSCIGILLLFIACFRSLQPLLFSFASIAYGCLCALVFCQWFFRDIHLLTLVFGASLIGVAIDYSLHYVTRARADSPTAQAPLLRLLPSLGMALLTSLIGYASLLQAPLPGLQQMALFSLVGLSASWLFVVAVFPLCSFKARGSVPKILHSTAQLPQRLWAHWPPQLRLYGLSALVLLSLLVCLTLLQPSTNIRILHTPDAQLLAQQQHIDAVLPAFASNQFFLLTGDSEQAVLREASAFKATLDKLVTAGTISDYQLLSDQLPPAVEQQRNYQTLQGSIYAKQGLAQQFMIEAGFDRAAIDRIQESFQQAQGQLLLPPEWLQSAPADKRLLWLGAVEEQFASIVLLKGITELGPLQQAAQTQTAVRFVNTVSDITAALSAQLRAASQMLALAYVAIGALLLLRYRRRFALSLLCIPLLSSLFTLALLTSAGVAISMFHVFALFLVLGLGMDYSIFLYESGTDSAHCQLAILLSVVTSGLSFGLLALSSTNMISTFGITVLLGSLLNWLLVPLVREKMSGQDARDRVTPRHRLS